MCGIFGAKELSRYIELYDLNKKRGNFATSLCVATTQGDVIIHRWSGSIGLKEAEREIKNSIKLVEQNTDMPCTPKFYLGHTQAPTSSKRKYDKHHAHPFNFQNWTLAHNGVLTNFNELKEHFDPKWKNPVDSSIIPYVIFETEEVLHNKVDNIEIEGMSNGLSLLKGTFGLWMFNSLTKNAFIARCGSTVFVNVLYNEFSSVEFKNSEPITEGHIYQLTNEGITTVGLFDFESPFFA